MSRRNKPKQDTEQEEQPNRPKAHQIQRRSSPGNFVSEVNNCDVRFICCKCEKMYEKNYDGYCENIKSHLKSDHHKETMIPLEVLNIYKASLRHLKLENLKKMKIQVLQK